MKAIGGKTKQKPINIKTCSQNVEEYKGGSREMSSGK